MLRKYVSDLSHVIDFEPVPFKDACNYIDQLLQIVDKKEQILEK